MKPVRIGIDMAAAAGRRTGLGSYVESLADAIRALDPSAASKPYELIEIRNVTKQLNTPKRMLWDRFGLPSAAEEKKVDVLFVPAFSSPKFRKPIVMTAHDIYGVVHPERFSQPAKHYWSKMLPNSMNRAKRLLCISEYTKRTIAQRLGIPEDRMTVIRPAAHARYAPIPDEDTKNRIAALGLKRPFVLSVGTIEPRKNYAKLVEAFANAKTDDTQLVIVGKRGWKYDDVFETIAKHGLENDVVFLD